MNMKHVFNVCHEKLEFCKKLLDKTDFDTVDKAYLISTLDFLMDLGYDTDEFWELLKLKNVKFISDLGAL